jgi:hypothetical protein
MEKETLAAADRLKNLTDDEIYSTVVGRTNLPSASLPRGVGFAQFCREVRAIANALQAAPAPKKTTRKK